MCGRYAVTLPPEAMRNLFKTLNLLDYPPRYNIAPTQPIVSVWQEAGQRKAGLLRWGLVPGWVKDPREFPLIINARADSMATKPAFRDALKHHRCVIPASGYYEWRTGADGKKQPYYITLEDGEPMAFAGLYSTWMGPDGEEIDTAAIVTTDAGPDTREIHHRMPAILEPEAVEPWLDVRSVDSRQAQAFIAPLPAGRAVYHPVSRQVSSARNEGADLIAPVPEPEAGEEGGKPVKVKAKNAGQLDLF